MRRDFARHTGQLCGLVAEHDELGPAGDLLVGDVLVVLADDGKGALKFEIRQDVTSVESVSIDRVKALAQGAAMETNDRAMLHALGTRAEEYYASADRLLPLIDADSRAALWVLVTIYHRLLFKIAKADSDVFTRRISVSTPAKLAILARGAAMAARNRGPSRNRGSSR